ncbi:MULTISPECIES: ABC transporter substrate-binding protein [unclassified Microbacterium]|uniref:ABC transporter substrate-binding protein n=1 Tax=unclassified Microbacterium TaxID=2609290 RepID=UPI000EAAAA1D|nr:MULTISPECIES: ABC transporter substrate-binding protein [unclassified Microbacterium]MBT2484728.1 ABC transporter substrate-binding protein [Microbacterium sp. ISL-108]RKN67611.1 zinc ABC transporter substrate-binding protein [Microbacterium sp. CGR2]
MTLTLRVRTRTAVIAVTTGTLLLTGCGTSVTPAADNGADQAAVTVENCGREIVLDAIPEAVVGMHPAQTELLLRLGLADRLAGQAQSTAQALPTDVAGLAESVPVIGDAMPPSREDLLSVEPDFVYSPTTYEFTAEQGSASIEQLEQAGAAVYVAAGGCEERRMSGEVSDLFIDLDNLGKIFDVEDAAAELVAESEADLAEVADAVADVENLRVAQVYVEGATLQGIGAGIEYDILRSAGADNVFTPEQPAFAGFFAATISPESLAAEQPEALVFSVYDEAHEAATREYLTSTFPDMPAVRDDRLIAVSSADVFPGTLGNVGAVRQIAEALYPDAF